MRGRRWSGWFVGVFLTTCFLGQATCAGALTGGVAKLDLTPSHKTPLAGYSRRRGKLSTGIHDRVSVRALVLREGGTTVALVSCDLLIIDERLYAAIQQRLRARWSGELPLLMVAATHTHSGPGAYGQKFVEKLSMGHYDPEVFAFLSEQIARAIVMASERLQPLSVSYQTATTEGLVRNRMQDEGPVDPELTVVTFRDQDRTPVAVVAHFSAHATTLGAWNKELSADYPGVLMRAVEQFYPSTVCFFLAGAVGDQGPVKQGEGFAPAQRLGQALAEYTLTLLAERPTVETESLRGLERTLTLPRARVRLGRTRLPFWLSRALVDDDATLTVVAVGRVLLLGMPCDATTGLGAALKRHARARGLQPVVVGFVNDYVGYCLPEALYEGDSYEASLAFNGPAAGEIMVKELQRMTEELFDDHD